MGAAGWGSVFIPALEWGHSELGALSQFFGPLGRLRDQGVCSLEEAGEGRTGLGPQGEPSAGPPCRDSVPWLSALTTAPPAQKRKAPPGLGVLSEKICTEASRTVGHCHSIVNTAASAPSFHREPCEYPHRPCVPWVSAEGISILLLLRDEPACRASGPRHFVMISHETENGKEILVFALED